MKPLVFAFCFLSTVLGVFNQATTAQTEGELSQEIRDWGPRPKDWKEAEHLFWVELLLRAPHQRLVYMADLMEQEGVRTGNKPLQARGICRRVIADIFNSDWSHEPKVQMELARKLTPPSPVVDDGQRLALAERMICDGVLKGMFFIKPEDGGLKIGSDEIFRGIAEAYNLQDDYLLTVGYTFALRVERMRSSTFLPLLLAFSANEFANATTNRELQLYTDVNLLRVAIASEMRRSNFCEELGQRLLTDTAQGARLHRIRFLAQVLMNQLEGSQQVEVARIREFNIEKWRRDQEEGAKTNKPATDAYSATEVNTFLHSCLDEIENGIRDPDFGETDRLIQIVEEVSQWYSYETQKQIKILSLARSISLRKYAERKDAAIQWYDQLLANNEFVTAIQLATRLSSELGDRHPDESAQWRKRTNEAFRQNTERIVPAIRRVNDFNRLVFERRRDYLNQWKKSERKASLASIEKERLRTTSLTGALIAAGLFAFGLIGYVWQLKNRRRFLETKVMERTRELKTAKELAEEGTNERELLLGRVCHDLRNPINVVSLCADMLACGADAEKLPKLLSQTAKSMQYQAGQLLTYSKSSSNVVAPKPISIPTMLSNIKSAVLVRHHHSGIHFQTRILGQPPFCAVLDENMLTEVLDNLVSNAFRHTETDGNISLIYGQRDDGRLFFQVKDSGCGMDKETLEQVFQPFFRGSNTSARQNEEKSVGLGMSICHRLTAAMGATIEIKSQVGIGTRCSIYFPDSIIHETIEPSLGRELKIAIIDDIKEIRVALSEALRINGHSVMTSDDTGLMQEVRDFDPDLVFIDLAMPTRTGLEIANELRRLLAQETRLVAMTATPAYRQEAYGADCFDDLIGKDRLMEDIHRLTAETQNH